MNDVLLCLAGFIRRVLGGRCFGVWCLQFAMVVLLAI